jgi:hypothetical protein
MALHILNNVFRLNLAFESPQRILQRLAFLQPNFCHFRHPYSQLDESVSSLLPLCRSSPNGRVANIVAHWWSSALRENERVPESCAHNQLLYNCGHTVARRLYSHAKQHYLTDSCRSVHSSILLYSEPSGRPLRDDVAGNQKYLYEAPPGDAPGAADATACSASSRRCSAPGHLSVGFSGLTISPASNGRIFLLIKVAIQNN